MKISLVVFLAGYLSVESFSSISIPQRTIPSSSSSKTLLFAGGFGGGGGASTKNKVDKKSSASKQIIKLKPKQQWDRYLAMKGTKKIPVGIRMKEDETEDWIQVGYVRSKDDAYTEVSVAMQRALIAEVRQLQQEPFQGWDCPVLCTIELTI